ncbi:Putative ribonuclease H protein [Apostasia shenzhenica]|uniref:Ribonuclease H protein n=1 Tax=Apostasia shenzhenica TaxID=1088818 RepID=A0A2H9ZY99_9ASPA|nr:Putative ribonuclease H protein [Apostasia shenzhenica]
MMTQVSSFLVSWTKPEFGRIKLNTVGFFVDGRASGGGIARDHEGNFVFAFHCEFGVNDALSADLYACLFGLNRCLTKGLTPIHIELQNYTSVNWLSHNRDIEWNFINPILKIRNLIGQLNANISFVWKEANGVADFFSKIKCTSQVFDNVEDIPEEATILISADRAGKRYGRRT